MADLQKLARARDLMQQRLDQPLTLPALCRAVGLNECTFKRGFREVHGRTPRQYLIGLRMQRAQALLHAGLPVSQVGQAVGYRHAASFSAAYRRHHGVAPCTVGR
jgi:transcriptional regulator GlxA family with amidase domain